MHRFTHCWQIPNSELRIAEDPQTFPPDIPSGEGGVVGGGAHDDVVAREPGKSDFRLMMGGSIMTRRISWLVVSFYEASRINFLSSFLSVFCCLELNTQMSAFTPPSPPRRLLKAAVKDMRTDSVRQDLGPSLRLNDLFPCIVFISLIRIRVAEAFPLTRDPVKRRSCGVFLRIHASSLDRQLSYATIKVVVQCVIPDVVVMLYSCYTRQKKKKKSYQLSARVTKEYHL